MFETFVIRPVFNLLSFIYAIIPGHDLGIAIIIFTIIVRLALWPLVKRQLHHGQAMKRLQPELKKIKAAAKGDRQKAAKLQMELYKERNIKPLSSIGTLIIQIPVFIALYQAILKITNNPHNLVDFSYNWVRDLPWIHTLSGDISKFDETFLGFVDLSRKGIEAGGAGIYIPAVAVAIASTFMQYQQTKLTIMNNSDSRKLSVILKEAASGKEADQSEVTAAVSRLMLYFLPIFTFVFALIVPSALSLYLLTSATVGFLQTRRVLGQDEVELGQISNDADYKPVVSAEKKLQKLVEPKAATTGPEPKITTKNGVTTKITISKAGAAATKPRQKSAKSAKKKRKK